jgi:hypothetical protein
MKTFAHKPLKVEAVQIKNINSYPGLRESGIPKLFHVKLNSKHSRWQSVNIGDWIVKHLPTACSGEYSEIVWDKAFKTKFKEAE